MNITGFKIYLQKMGKKQNVIDNIIRSLEYSANYFTVNMKKELDTIQKSDLDIFLQEHKNEKRGLKTHLRSMALYFNFISSKEIAAYANSLREKEISSTRKTFKLSELLDIDEKHLKKLEENGIKNVIQMIKVGDTEIKRKELSKKLKIPYDAILKLVKLSDLCRIPGIKGIRSKLYYESGFDTMNKLSECEPQKLRNYLIEYVKNNNFEGIAPLPKEIEFTIKKAKELKKEVDYS